MPAFSGDLYFLSMDIFLASIPMVYTFRNLFVLCEYMYTGIIPFLTRDTFRHVICFMVQGRIGYVKG